jgi:heme exporter protein D
MWKKYLWILFYFLSPAIPVIAIFNSNTTMYSDFSNFVAMAAGTTGFVWLAYEFVLSSRPVFIERCFGMDKFYRFHGLMAIISLILVFIHQTIIYDAPAAVYGNIAFYIFIAITVITLVFMVNSIVLKIKPILMIRKALEKYSLFKCNSNCVCYYVYTCHGNECGEI